MFAVGEGEFPFFDWQELGSSHLLPRWYQRARHESSSLRWIHSESSWDRPGPPCGWAKLSKNRPGVKKNKQRANN